MFTLNNNGKVAQWNGKMHERPLKLDSSAVSTNMISELGTLHLKESECHKPAAGVFVSGIHITYCTPWCLSKAGFTAGDKLQGS